MTIIKFLWEKLGTIIIPIGIELLSPTVWEFLSPTFGDKNSQIPKSWGQKFPKIGDKNSQITKSWGQKLPKVAGKNPKSWAKVRDKNCKTVPKEIAQKHGRETC